MKKFLRVSFVCFSIFFFIGCSIDSAQVGFCPEEVKPEGSANVILFHTFNFIDTSANISIQVNRDSLHLLVGMPEGWSVESASFVVIRNFSLSEVYNAYMSGGEVDTNYLEMLNPADSEFIPMSKDKNLINFMKGKEVVARGIEGDSISVKVDNVQKWEGFSAPVNIVLEKGKRNDMVLPFDSLANISTPAEESGLNPPFLGKMRQVTPPTFEFDSLGITMVPIVVKINLKAGKKEGTDTILYFTKTASMNELPSPLLAMIATMSPEMPSMSNLNWLFTPITVSETAKIKSNFTRSTQLSKGNIWIEQKREYIIVRYNKNLGISREARIYSLKGDLIKKIVANTNENCFKWDGTNNNGVRVSKGTYYVKIVDKEGKIFTQSVNIF